MIVRFKTLVMSMLVLVVSACSAKRVDAPVSTQDAIQVLVPDAIRLWSDYDDMRGTRQHRAIDIKAKKGARILAAKAGVVKARGRHKTAGKWLEIQHDGGLVTRYLHLNGFAKRPGQQVRGGQCIGRVGDTGNARNVGPHLHFEWVHKRQKQDPMPHLRRLARLKPGKR